MWVMPEDWSWSCMASLRLRRVFWDRGGIGGGGWSALLRGVAEVGWFVEVVPRAVAPKTELPNTASNWEATSGPTSKWSGPMQGPMAALICVAPSCCMARMVLGMTPEIT